MAVLREICEKDPINSAYITRYANLLVQQKSAQVAANPESQQPGNVDLATTIKEASKVFEKSLRYNSSQVDLWASYLQFYQDQDLSPEGEAELKNLFERAI